MSAIFPFRALRPTPERAAQVAAVPYDVVNREEAAEAARGNPLSFLYVSRAEIDLPAETDPYDSRVYERATENLTRLKREAPLVVESEPSLYLYRLRMGTHEQTGVAACCSLDEYDRDLVKKHERTRQDKEDDRTRHMVALSAQTGPVFLTYKADRAIDDIVARVSQAPPLFDFRAADGVEHALWRVPQPDTDPLVRAFGALPALYIADGHHRAASAARARQQLRGAMVGAGPAGGRESGSPGIEADRMLVVAFPHDQVQILPYNRTVKDLAGLSPEAFLERVKAVGVVKDGVPAPARKGEVSMYLAGRWYTIELGAAAIGRDRRSTLDVSVLQDLVIEPILKIADITRDKRIDFIGGARGTQALERLVDSGQAAVAFSMFPVTVADLIEISDEGGIMPPKSTWFEPKLRDGLLIHTL